MKKLQGFSVFLCAASCLAACGGRGGGARPAASDPGAPLKGQNPEDLKGTVASGRDFTISVGDFQKRLNEQSPYIRTRYTSLERKKEFLDNMVRFEVLAGEAQRKGFDKDAEVI